MFYAHIDVRFMVIMGFGMEKEMDITQNMDNTSNKYELYIHILVMVVCLLLWEL